MVDDTSNSDINYDRFGDVLNSMVTSLKKQGVTLTDISSSVEEQLNIQKESLEEQRRIAELSKVSRTTVEQKKTNDPSFSISKFLGTDIGADLGKLGFGGGIAAILTNAISGVAGILSPAKLAGMVIKGGIAGVIGPVLGNFIGGMTTDALERMGASPEFSASVGDGIETLATWTIIGKMIGGKFGALFGAGARGIRGAIYNILDKHLNVSEKGEEIAKSFGIEFEENSMFPEMIGTGLAGALTLLAPTLLKKAGTVILGALTGPIGLAVLTGAAVAGTVALVDKWLTEKRSKFFDELEGEVEKGFANMKEAEQEEDIPFFRRIALSMGAEPQNKSEELDVLRRQVEAESEFTGIGGFGEEGSKKVLDEEVGYKIRTNVNRILEGANISDLSDTNLENLKSIADQTDMYNLVKQIDKEMESRKAVSTANMFADPYAWINSEDSPKEQQKIYLERSRKTFVTPIVGTDQFEDLEETTKAYLDSSSQPMPNKANLDSLKEKLGLISTPVNISYIINAPNIAPVTVSAPTSVSNSSSSMKVQSQSTSEYGGLAGLN